MLRGVSGNVMFNRAWWYRLAISVAIVCMGFGEAYVLSRVDQDLRAIYAEYTLAVVDLAHANTELSRYRTTILRAVEASSRRDFERIAGALPTQRDHISTKIQQIADLELPIVTSKDREIQGHLDDLESKLDEYLSASRHTMELVHSRWETSSMEDASRLRAEAESYAVKDAGGKFIAVALALDNLVGQVATVASEIRSDGERRLRRLTLATVACTVVFVLSIIYVPVSSKPAAANPLTTDVVAR